MHECARGAGNGATAEKLPQALSLVVCMTKKRMDDAQYEYRDG